MDQARPNLTPLCAALQSVSRDARLVTRFGVQALRPAAEQLGAEARAASASVELLALALEECLATRILVHVSQEADARARGQVLRWALEAYQSAD